MIEPPDPSGGSNGRFARLDAAIDAIHTTPMPVDAVVRVVGVARGLRPEDFSRARASHTADSPVRRRFRRPIAIVAALTAACMLAWLAPGVLAHRRAIAAFAEVVEKAREATTVRFTVTMKFGRFGPFKALQWMAGNRFRYEQVDSSIVQVVDLEHQKKLTLDTANRLAHVSDIPITEEQGVELLNPVRTLAGCAERGVKPIPGNPDMFQAKQGTGVIGLSSTSDMLITVDQTSRLPIRITILDSTPEPGWEVTLDEFHWNVPIDGAFLSLELPEGYALTADPIVGRPPHVPDASRAVEDP